MKLVLASDPVGYPLKEEIKAMLIAAGHEVQDVGTLKEDAPVGHNVAAKNAAKLIQSGEAERGILVCGTGMGVAIAANKFKGVYAGAVESLYAAQTMRIINDCNIMCIGRQIVGPGMAMDMVNAFLTTGFGTGFAAPMAPMLAEEFKTLQTIEAENMQ